MALVLEREIAGRSMLAKMAMIAMTTNNSIKVKPERFPNVLGRRIPHLKHLPGGKAIRVDLGAWKTRTWANRDRHSTILGTINRPLAVAGAFCKASS